MTTTSGNPIWARSTGITDYGGHTEKANYQSQGVVDPRTDVGAAAIMRMADHLTCCARTAPFCEINFTQDDTGADDPTVNYCLIMPSGKLSASYPGDTPTTGFPTVTRNGDGNVTVAFSTSYTDAYGVSADLDLQFCLPEINDATCTHATHKRTNAYTFEIYSWNSTAGTAATDKTVTAVFA